MRYAGWFLVPLLGALTFGQTAPESNAAAAGIPPKFIANAKPSVCSIPLLNVKPRSTNDRMPIKKPPVSAYEKSRELKLQVPAPACDEKLFQNK